MVNKDYYQILGVSKNSTQNEIKQAYRKLAREHHPDMVADTDKKAAEKRFKEINEAYQVLNDPQKRKMYDQYGHAGFQGFTGNKGGPAGQGFGGAGGQRGPFTYTYSTSGGGNNAGFDFDPFDVFEEFFGFRGFGGSARQRKGKNLYYEMQVDFKDAVSGLEKEISIESGKVKIKVPKGVRDGTELRFSGKGMPGPDKLPSGDLFITIRIKSPDEFHIIGSDIFMNKKIDIVQASLGDVLEVHIVDEKSKNGIGTSKLKIPAGTQPGTKFIIRNKGMPKLNGTGNGNAFVQVFVDVPTRLSKKQKDILKDFNKK
jgi:DnaJ-class molecular chaperone